jgi:hypothetical protein
VDEPRAPVDRLEDRADGGHVHAFELRGVPPLVRDEAGDVEDDAATVARPPHLVAAEELAPRDLDAERHESRCVASGPHERAHVLAALDEARDDVTAEEPGRARDEDGH